MCVQFSKAFSSNISLRTKESPEKEANSHNKNSVDQHVEYYVLVRLS